MTDYFLHKLSKICLLALEASSNSLLEIGDCGFHRIPERVLANIECLVCGDWIKTEKHNEKNSGPTKLVATIFTERTRCFAHFGCLYSFLKNQKNTKRLCYTWMLLRSWEILRLLLGDRSTEESLRQAEIYSTLLLFDIIRSPYPDVNVHCFLSRRSLERLLGLLEQMEHPRNGPKIAAIKETLHLIGTGPAETPPSKNEDHCMEFYFSIQRIYNLHSKEPDEEIASKLLFVLEGYIATLRSLNFYLLEESLMYILLNTAPDRVGKFFKPVDVVLIIKALYNWGCMALINELKVSSVYIHFDDMIEIMRYISHSGIPWDSSLQLLFDYFSSCYLFLPSMIWKIVMACSPPPEKAAKGWRGAIWEGLSVLYDYLGIRLVGSVDVLRIVEMYYMWNGLGSPSFLIFFKKFYKCLKFREFSQLVELMGDSFSLTMVKQIFYELSPKKTDSKRLKIILGNLNFNQEWVKEEVQNLICRKVISESNFLKLVSFLEKSGKYPFAVAVLLNYAPRSYYTSLSSTGLDVILMICDKLGLVDHVFLILRFIDSPILLKNLSKLSIKRVMGCTRALIGALQQEKLVFDYKILFFYIYFYGTVKTAVQSDGSIAAIQELLLGLIESPYFEGFVVVAEIKRVCTFLARNKDFVGVYKRLEKALAKRGQTWVGMALPGQERERI